MNESIKQMGPNNTKYNILDFSPSKAPVAPPSKKKGKGKNFNKQGTILGVLGQGTLAELDDEDSEEDQDYLASLEEHRKRQAEEEVISDQKLHEIEKNRLDQEIR